MTREDLARSLCKRMGDQVLNTFGMDKEEMAKVGSDFVLSTDLEAEKLALKEIGKFFPEDRVLSEEKGEIVGEKKFGWVIDPLDGTVNFRYKIPYFCSSVSIEQDGRLMYAVIYNPVSEEMFWARKGEGAYLGEERLGVSDTMDMKRVFVAYATSNHVDERSVRVGSRVMRKVLENCRAMRQQGSSLLDFCHLARGNFDGLVKVSGNYWDYAAGKLMVEEAGGKVTDLKGNEPKGVSDVLASNEGIHERLLELLGQVEAEEI